MKNVARFLKNPLSILLFPLSQEDDGLSLSWMLLQAGLTTATAVKCNGWLQTVRGKALVGWLIRRGVGERRGEGEWEGGRERRVAMTRMEVNV